VRGLRDAGAAWCSAVVFWSWKILLISYDLIWISYDFLGSPSSSDFINGGYGLVGKIIENASRWMVIFFGNDG